MGIVSHLRVVFYSSNRFSLRCRAVFVVFVLAQPASSVKALVSKDEEKTINFNTKYSISSRRQEEFKYIIRDNFSCCKVFLVPLIDLNRKDPHRRAGESTGEGVKTERAPILELCLKENESNI